MAQGVADRVLLLGSNGQLGTELHHLLENDCELHAFARDQADFSRPEELRGIVADLRPSIILNTAAYTAVDKAESEPELAELINARSPAALAGEAASYGGLLIHYSTDYVFDGSKRDAWIENDATGPLNVYGSTKLAGERAIAEVGGPHLIFRTSWVFAPHGRNFLLTILRLARERDRLTIVADQHGSPTSAQAIAHGTLKVLSNLRERGAEPHTGWAGVYHMTCGGETNWQAFAQAIVDEAAAADLLGGRHPEVVPIHSGQYPTPAKRPANSVLNNGKLLRQFGVALPGWREALREAVREVRSSEGERRIDRLPATVDSA
jgi:dTDP-4-dehydrorhamnose reductase